MGPALSEAERVAPPLRMSCALFNGLKAHTTLLRSLGVQKPTGIKLTQQLQECSISIDHDLLLGGYLAVKLACVELHLDVERFFIAVEF